MIDAIFGRTDQILEKSMRLCMVRQGWLASNIANAETPNYRAVDIDFQATMEKLIEKARRLEEPPMEVRTSHVRHFTMEEIQARHNEPQGIVFAAADSLSIGNDSNSVDLEVQLANLQANSARFAVLAQLLNRHLGDIKNVIESSSRV